MSEIWTPIVAQDDPDSGLQAIAKGRAYRDNDECLVRSLQTVQRSATISGFNQTYPNRVATGIAVSFYKPPYAKKLSFQYHLSKTSIGSVRAWAVVRFNNNPALETPLGDTSAGGYVGWFDVVDFDLSSLPAGVYIAEIFAGNAGAAGDSWYARIPAGRRTQTEPAPPSMLADSTLLRPFQWSGADWSSSPASDLLDATHLTADKGLSQTVAQMFYDRDQKLVRRPAGYFFTGAAKSSSFTHPAWQSFDLPKIYVPKSGDVLALNAAIRTTAGGQANALMSCVEMEADFPFAHPQVVGDGIGSTSTTFENKILSVNLAPMRGREATLRLWLNNSVAAKTTDFLLASNQAGHRWEPQPYPATYWGGAQQTISDDWQRWAAAGRQQGALLSSAWWHRITKRDLDLQCRQFSQREFSYTVPASVVSFSPILDNQMTIYQPKGMGASGGKLVAYIQAASSSGFTSALKLDYTDQPDGSGGGNGWEIAGVGDGKYRLERPARSDRDGTAVSIGMFWMTSRVGIVYSAAGDDCHKMRWEV